MTRLRRLLARRKWCPRTDTNEWLREWLWAAQGWFQEHVLDRWERSDAEDDPHEDAAVQALAQSGRTIPITDEMRARAVGKMLSRSPKVIRITAGQRKAIVEGTARKRGKHG